MSKNCVLSFDIGLRHLAYAVCEAVAEDELSLVMRYRLISWRLIDMKTSDPWAACEFICQHLNTEWPLMSSRVGTVVLERQMSAKMKALFYAAQMYFLCQGVAKDRIVALDPRYKLQVYDDVVSNEDAVRLLGIKTRAKKNKILAIAHARQMLRDDAVHLAELEQFEKEDKGDDVSDAMLQGFAYLKRRQEARVKAHFKEETTKKRKRKNMVKRVGRIYPSSGR